MISELDMWFLAFIWMFFGMLIEWKIKPLRRLEKLTEKNRKIKQ